MTYRDELEQAHRRIDQLEEALDEEQQKNAPPPEPAVRVSEAAMAPSATKRFSFASLFQWWPAPIAVMTAIAYPIAFGLTLPAADDPWRWGVLSAFAGSLLYTGDVALRARSADGERTVLGRILFVLAIVAAAPVLIGLFFVGGEVLGVAIPVGMTIAGIVALVRWIRTGKGAD